MACTNHPATIPPGNTGKSGDTHHLIELVKDGYKKWVSSIWYLVTYVIVFSVNLGRL